MRVKMNVGMDRIPEPELMDDEAQAKAYADADFAAPHERCAQYASTSRATSSASARPLNAVDSACLTAR
jgi:hypothetical protein